MGPWEDYQQAQAGPSGPWSEYADHDAPNETAGPLSSEPTGPLSQAIGRFLESKKAPDLVNQLKTDLLTNEHVDGLGNAMVRGLPATAGGIAAGPIGAAALESARQGAVGIYAATGGTAAPTLMDALGRPALAGVTQQAADLASPYLGKALVGGTVQGGSILTPGTHVMPQELGGAAGAIGGAAQDTLRYLGVNLAGVKPASYEVAEQAGASALKPFLNAEPSAGDALAEKARGLISQTVKAGEDAYPKLIDAAKANPQYAGKTINLQDALGDKILSIADNYGFQTTPGLKAPAESTKFWRFAQQADGLKDASIEQVYAFQKQLNSLARANAGKPLGSAFGQLKSAVQDILGKEIPEIGQANAKYAAAKALEEETGKLTNANDLLGYVTKAYRNPQNTLQKQALESAATQVPGLADVLGEIKAYSAAQDFSPVVRGLPQTGMGAQIANGFVRDPLAAGAAVQYATGNPALAAGSAALVAGRNLAVSPRLNLALLGASQNAAPALTSAAKATAQGVRSALPALAQAFSHMSPESISAFYKSP
jgi:hypothetical protein